MIFYLCLALRRIPSCRRGNVAVIFALAALPIVFAMGMGLDYVSAAKRRDKLNAISDAAALSAVTPSMMAQTASVAKAAAIAMFNAQASVLGGVTVLPGSPVVTVTDTSGATGTTRAVSVAYQATSANTFPKVLGPTGIQIGGTSASQAETQPNINFYLMLDTSPSMAIAATTSGIATMVANTPKQSGGCAFACHQTNPAGDNLGNPGGIDNYQLARNLGVTLRIDLVQQAVSSLMDTANSTMAITKAAYQMAIYDFDTTYHPIQTMTTPTIAKAAASNIQLLTVYQNGYLTANNANNDQDTSWDSGMSGLNAAMGTPGNGTNNPGDSPQEVLFIVTDGVIDESAGGGRNMSAMGDAGGLNSKWCTTVKNRNIRIAVLYTTYNPLPTNSFYNYYIAPFQPNIANSLQSCASPGLFFQVNTGGDITAAMNTLFQTAVNVAHLTQ